VPLGAGLVAVVELLVLRIATRSFVNIPGLDRWATPLRGVTEAGRLSYYLAVVLLVVTWGWAIWACAASSHHPLTRVLVVAAIVGFAICATLYRLGVFGTTVMGWTSLTSFSALALALTQAPRLRRAPIILFAGAALLAGLATFFSASGIEPATLNRLLTGGEVLTVAAGATAPLVLGERLTRRAAVVALAVATVATAALALRPSPARILVLWAFGMPVGLPAWTYGVAAGFLVATIWQGWSSKRWELIGGLLLLAAGGVGLISTYQSALVVGGLAVMAVALPLPQPDGQPSFRVRRASAVSVAEATPGL
jgi:hypothetical protein